MRDLTGVDCIGYVRVSTDKQAGEAQTSPADQRRAIEAKAAALGRTIGAWFRDEGFSGATIDKRPDMLALIASCEASPRRGGRGIVLALNDSRWGRFPNPEEATYWRFHLERVGWDVRFTVDDETEGHFRGLIRYVAQTQATDYRENIKRNAKRGARGTAEQGYWTTRAPYGYRRKVVHPPGRERVLDSGIRKAPDEKVALTVEPTEARIVAQAFERYALGLESGASLTAWLQRHAPGREWAKPSVMHMLRNPAYVGDVQLGRRLHSGDGKHRDGAWRRPTSEWFGKVGAHEPIVLRTVFLRVQERLQQNAGQVRSVAGHYLVTGLVQCATCGAPIIGGGVGSHLVGGERQRFYRCGSIERGIVCPGRLGCISKHRLEGAILDTIGRELTRKSAQRSMAQAFDRWEASRRHADAPDRLTLARTLKGLQQQRDRLVASIAAGILTDADARAQMQALRQQIAATEAQIQATTHRRDALGQSDELRAVTLRMMAAFRETAARLEGLELRNLITPWLAGAAFDKQSRMLTLHIRRIPFDLIPGVALADSPGRAIQPQACHVTRRVALNVGRTGWAHVPSPLPFPPQDRQP